MFGKKVGILIIVAALSSSLCSCKNNNYNISFNIENYADTVLYLVNTVGDKNYSIDTSYSNTGNFIFEGKWLLPSGLYILSDRSMKEVLNFFVDDKDQCFSISGAIPLTPSNLKVKNSTINEDFYAYIDYITKKQVESQPFRKQLSMTPKSSPDFAEIEKQLISIDKQVSDFSEQLIKKNDGNVLALYLLANQRIEAPYKENFWKQFKADDARLLRTPVYINQINNYLDNITFPVNDSIRVSVDEIIDRIKGTPEVLQNILWYLTIKYESSELMGQDAIFVYIVDKYYASGFNTWFTKDIINVIVEKANSMRRVLVGNKAANISLYDSEMKIKSLYDIESKYTIVYFWDDECPNCKNETPKLKKLYSEKKDKFGIEVFGVYIGESMTKMKEYIKEHGIQWTNVDCFISPTGEDSRDLYNVSATPAIFLLDENKIIMAKMIPTEEIEKFIEWKENIK